MVDHPVYYLGNLIIAKYLELTHGFKIWALISSKQDLKVVLTAKSFGVDGITYIRDEAAKEASPVAAAVIRHLENTSDVELRKRLLAIQINGIPVGDLIYDTYVRETRRITIRAFDDDLKAYLILLVNYCTLYERLLGALDVGAVVLGHTVYSRFGVLARVWRQRREVPSIRGSAGKGCGFSAAKASIKSWMSFFACNRTTSTR